MRLTRREFLTLAAASGLGMATPVGAVEPGDAKRPLFSGLVDRFRDLPRHFVVEYYPWYATMPYRHWNEADRRPPVDVASNYMPKLGAYDSRSTTVMEQHARWIKETGAGAINVSWWGRGSDIDRLVPRLMDVMAAYDLHVAFHLEPYAISRARNYARDIQYLVTEYGDRRHWDCFLLLENADGTSGPVFKSFRTILPAQTIDCHGVRSDVPDYTVDGVWRDEIDLVRETFRHDFDRLTLLADSLNVERTSAAGFDGVAIYDNFVEPADWVHHAHAFSSRGLVFSFNTNPGFDGVAPRSVDPSSCYRPPPFAPGAATYDWNRSADRAAAEAASASRIVESFRQTLTLQTNPTLSNASRGFLLTYINSFNEWHEGHQFEPMKDRAALSKEERAVGYHNADDGAYRLRVLTDLLTGVLEN